MSGFGSIRAEVDPGPGEKQREAARLTVCGLADRRRRKVVWR